MESSSRAVEANNCSANCQKKPHNAKLKAWKMSPAKTTLDILESNNIRLATIQQQKEGPALAKRPLHDWKSMINDKIQTKVILISVPLLFQKLYSNKADLNDIPCKTNIKKKEQWIRLTAFYLLQDRFVYWQLLLVDNWVYHVIYRIERDINGNGSIRCDVIARRILSETKASSPLPRW